MNQPVKMPAALVLDARLTGQTSRRSIAGQIEFWANVGRAVEPLLQGNVAMALCRAAATHPVSECLEDVDSAKGRERLSKYLAERPYPHYEPASGHPGLLVRTDDNGTRTVGRFVNREFKVAHPTKSR